MCYQKIQKPNLAEHNFLIAARMVPNRLTPHYHLLCLYAGMGQAAKAESAATQLMRMPVKVPSDETDRMKREADLYLKTHQLPLKETFADVKIFIR